MTKEERRQKLESRLLEMKIYEEELYGRGYNYIAGCDEVGRGPLAGPVVAAAVVLPKNFAVPGVDDSKKVTERNRNILYEEIKEKALAYGIGYRDNKIIDEINILEATKLAMADAISAADMMLTERKSQHIDFVLFDAIKLKDLKIEQMSLIKGDSKSISIAAASILAKVTRDRLMVEYHREYPYYNFDRNKGYGTKAHYEGLKEHGTTTIHRKTFLKNLYK